MPGAKVASDKIERELAKQRQDEPADKSAATASETALDGDGIRIGARATIATGWPGCISEAEFIQLNGIAHSGETYEFLEFLNAKKATGECIAFPAGTKVWIENISEQKHVCVRFIDGDGERTCYWVETDDIRVTP
jgi:hypothetical protein